MCSLIFNVTSTVKTYTVRHELDATVASPGGVVPVHDPTPLPALKDNKV